MLSNWTCIFFNCRKTLFITKKRQISRRVLLFPAYPVSNLYLGQWSDRQEDRGRDRVKRWGRGWSSGSHVVRHARDNQCSDVIITVSPTNRGSAPFKPASLGVSKWKLGEFHRTLAWLQFGLDHWEARIRAVGRASLGVHVTFDERFFLVSLVDEANPQVRRHDWPNWLIHEDLIWRNDVDRKKKKLDLRRSQRNILCKGFQPNEDGARKERKSDSWENADSAFWFIVGPRRAPEWWVLSSILRLVNKSQKSIRLFLFLLIETNFNKE